MAKAKGSSETKKVVFGTRRKGKAAKTVGPKSQKKKRYIGQGR
jgi:hypothetical protein